MFSCNILRLDEIVPTCTAYIYTKRLTLKKNVDIIQNISEKSLEVWEMRILYSTNLSLLQLIYDYNYKR